MLGAALLTVATLGCGPAPAPGSRISATRVLGARVETAGDPTRVWPRPGETALLTWLVVGPAAPRPLAWSFFAVACPHDRDTFGCVQRQPRTPVATTSGASDGSAPPTFELVVPDAAALGAVGADRLVVGGVICAGGAVLDPEAAAWSRCQTSAGQVVDEADVLQTIALAVDAEGNAPPTLTDDPFTWDDVPWTAGASDSVTAGGGGACADDATLPRVAWGEDPHRVIVTADAADRDALDSVDPPRREGLQLSAFATHGSFESQFAGVATTDAAATTPLRVDWTPPSESDVPAVGFTVRFTFVLRDLRGGIDWQTRTVCLLPSSAP
jgi:hypothetical protein